MANQNPNFVHLSGDLGRLLLLKSRLQEHFYQFLGSIGLPELMAVQDIPLTMKTEVIAWGFDSALLLRVKEPATRSHILASLPHSWPSALSLGNHLAIPLACQILPNLWLRFRLDYQDLWPWWQAIAMELKTLTPQQPTTRGITAPAPWGIYQYVYVQLSHWQQLHPLPHPNRPEPTILPARHQQLWRGELALLEVLTAPLSSPLALHPLIMSVCATAMDLVSHPLPNDNGEELGRENWLLWHWGLVALAQYLLGEILTQLGRVAVPQQL